MEHILRCFQKLFRFPEHKFSVLHAGIVITEAFGWVNLFQLFGVQFNKGDNRHTTSQTPGVVLWSMRDTMEHWAHETRESPYAIWSQAHEQLCYCGLWEFSSQNFNKAHLSKFAKFNFNYRPHPPSTTSVIHPCEVVLVYPEPRRRAHYTLCCVPLWLLGLFITRYVHSYLPYIP